MNEQYLIDSWVGGHSIQIGEIAGDATIMLEHPSFRLELLQSSAPAELPAKVRRQPSFLLHPGNQVVPYRPPLAELRALTAWRDSDEQLSVLLLHGPGGQGKTRTAQYVASGSAAAGWSVAQARDVTSAAAGRRSVVSGPADRLLIVVDYAERWRYPSLLALLGSAGGTGGARTVRVLLLARSETQLWDQLEAELDGLDIAYDPPIALTGFAGPSRETLFAEAGEAFAHALGVPELSPAVPTDLADPAYASPLTLHMAALAGVVAAIEEHERPTEQPTEQPTEHPTKQPNKRPSDISKYLLLHEQRRWNASPAAGSMRAMAALATLFGPSGSNESARALLCATGAADSRAEADRVLREYRSLYPSERHLAPLRPDRFGEDFLGWHLSRDPAAGEDLAALLTAEDGPLGEGEVRQALIVLANAARHASVGELLNTVINIRPALALASPAVLLAVAEHLPVRTAVIALYLPIRGVELAYVRLRLVQRIADDISAHAEVPIDVQVETLSLLGKSLTDYGERVRAADAFGRAVELLRGHLDDAALGGPLRLADLLNLQAEALILAERKSDALPLAAEAVHLVRDGDRDGDGIRDGDPDRDPDGVRDRDRDPGPSDAETIPHLAMLARSLTNYSDSFEEEADLPGALVAAEESAALYERLAGSDPEEYGWRVAEAETSLSRLLLLLGRTDEALERVQRVADYGRRLMALDPERYRTEQAAAQHNLGRALIRAGRSESAVPSLSEAADHYRFLVQHVPLRYLGSLAECLFAMAGELEQLEREEELLRVRRELVAVERQLRQLGLEVDDGRFAITLYMLGRQLERAGDHAHALPLLVEGVAVLRSLLPTHPGMAGILWDPLLSLAATLEALGDEVAAVAANREALELLRGHGDTSDPAIAELIQALELGLGLRSDVESD